MESDRGGLLTPSSGFLMCTQAHTRTNTCLYTIAEIHTNKQTNKLGEKRNFSGTREWAAYTCDFRMSGLRQEDNEVRRKRRRRS